MLAPLMVMAAMALLRVVVVMVVLTISPLALLQRPRANAVDLMVTTVGDGARTGGGLPHPSETRPTTQL